MFQQLLHLREIGHVQQLAGAIIFMLTGSIIALNFITDIMLALFDPRIRRGIMGSA